MFVMASAFGLWRAGIISKGFFALGVVAVVLVLLGGTTWARTGFWAPDSAYTQVLWPTLMAVWDRGGQRLPDAPPCDHTRRGGGSSSVGRMRSAASRRRAPVQSVGRVFGNDA
jgi:hypothetical protein